MRGNEDVLVSAFVTPSSGTVLAESQDVWLKCFLHPRFKRGRGGGMGIKDGAPLTKRR
jgi:hypothetical protein